MKKIFTLLLSSLFSLSLLAYDGSRLSVSTISNSTMNFKVEIDGKRIALKDNSVTISNLSSGSHNIRIYREVKKGRNGNGNGFAFGRNKQEIIYATTVFLRKGYHLDITVNRFGKALVDERKIVREEDWLDNEEDYYDDADWDYGYRQGMEAAQFESVKQSISKEWMESSRLISVKTIMDKNQLTTQQVKELMSLFSFESNKLEVAKYGYRSTVDKENFHQVNEVLNFSSSRDELARFIRESH